MDFLQNTMTWIGQTIPVSDEVKGQWADQFQRSRQVFVCPRDSLAGTTNYFDNLTIEAVQKCWSSTCGAALDHTMDPSIPANIADIIVKICDSEKEFVIDSIDLRIGCIAIAGTLLLSLGAHVYWQRNRA